MKILEPPAPPAGLRRLFFRLPVHLYRLRLGMLLGNRFLLLHHVGRVSGTPHRAVIEVIEQGADGHVVCSGFGARSDWYRNLLKTPDTTIQVGGRELPVTARFLKADEGGELMARYAPRHPKAAMKLVRFMGFAVDGSEEDYRLVGRELPFVRFVPRG